MHRRAAAHNVARLCLCIDNVVGGRETCSGAVTVIRYPPRFPPRWQITGDVVPRGVAFHHYELFCFGYKITGEIAPRVPDHQRAAALALVGRSVTSAKLVECW